MLLCCAAGGCGLWDQERTLLPLPGLTYRFPVPLLGPLRRSRAIRGVCPPWTNRGSGPTATMFDGLLGRPQDREPQLSLRLPRSCLATPPTSASLATHPRQSPTAYLRKMHTTAGGPQFVGLKVLGTIRLSSRFAQALAGWCFCCAASRPWSMSSSTASAASSTRNGSSFFSAVAKSRRT